MMSKKKRILKKHDTVNGSEILQSPVEVGSVSHNLQGFSTIPRWNSQNFYFCYPTFWVVFPIVVVPWNFKTSPRLTTSGSIPVLMICGASFSFWTYDRKQRREKNQLAGPTATNEGMRVQDLHPQVIPGSKGWGTLIPYESGQPEKCLVGEKKSLGRRKENSEDFAGKGAKTSKKKRGKFKTSKKVAESLNSFMIWTFWTMLLIVATSSTTRQTWWIHWPSINCYTFVSPSAPKNIPPPFWPSCPLAQRAWVSQMIWWPVNPMDGLLLHRTST